MEREDNCNQSAVISTCDQNPVRYIRDKQGAVIHTENRLCR